MSGKVMWMMVICRRHKGVLGGWLDSTYFLFIAGGGGAAGVVHAYHGRHTNLTTAMARVYGGRRHAAEKAECRAVQVGMWGCTGWSVGMCRTGKEKE